MATHSRDSADYETGLALAVSERIGTPIQRAGRIGSRVLQIYTLAQTGIKIGLSVAAMTSSLLTAHSNEGTAPPDRGVTNGWAANTSTNTGDITVNNDTEVYDPSQGDVVNDASSDVVVVSPNTPPYTGG